MLILNLWMNRKKLGLRESLTAKSFLKLASAIFHFSANDSLQPENPKDSEQNPEKLPIFGLGIQFFYIGVTSPTIYRLGFVKI